MDLGAFTSSWSATAMSDNRPTGKRSRAEAEDDAGLWLRAMRDTTPLSPRRRHPGETEGSPADRSRDVSEAQEGGASPPAAPGAAAGRAPPPQRPATAGKLDKQLARRLKRGVQGFEDRLDLHGMTQREAHAELRRFIRDAADRGCRCVLVITGKGSRSDGGSGVRGSAPGVLRQSAPRWLGADDLSPHVVGFEAALPKHGGTGALYVQLRRSRSGGRD